MKAGDLDVTVFQNAAGQGKGAVDTALSSPRAKRSSRRSGFRSSSSPRPTLDKYMTKN